MCICGHMIWILNTDQRFGDLLSSTWCYGHCPARSFPRLLLVCSSAWRSFGLVVRYSRKRTPASNELIFDSVELWNTEVTKHTDLGFASAGPSPALLSWALFDMVLCFLFQRKWLQEHIGKIMIFQQTKKMIPFIRRETTYRLTSPQVGSWCQHVWFAFWWIQIDSVKQPIQRNFVGSWHVSHRWTSASDDHLDHCFVVFKNAQPGLCPENNVRLWSHDLDFDHSQTNIQRNNFRFCGTVRHIQNVRLPKKNSPPFLIILICVSVKNCDDQIP